MLFLSKLYNQLKARSKPSPPLPKAIWTNPLYFIAFGFGSGAIPVAPGTFATLFAIPIYLLLRPLPFFAYMVFVVTFIFFLAAGYLSGLAVKPRRTIILACVLMNSPVFLSP